MVISVLFSLSGLLCSLLTQVRHLFVHLTIVNVSFIVTVVVDDGDAYIECLYGIISFICFLLCTRICSI